MPDPFEKPLMQLMRTIVALKPVLIDAIGVEAVNFVDDNFAKQGYQGSSLTPWPKRRTKDKGAARALLVQTAALRRSIRHINSNDRTTIGTDIPYAKIHNEGGDIRHPYRTVTLNFRKVKGVDFEMHGKYSLKLAKGSYKGATEQRYSSVYNHVVKMPRRQFIPTADSPSPILTQRCEKVIIRKITAALPK